MRSTLQVTNDYATLASHASPTGLAVGAIEYSIPTFVHPFTPSYSTPINTCGFCGHCGTVLTSGCMYFCCECGHPVDHWEEYSSSEEFILIMFPTK